MFYDAPPYILSKARSLRLNMTPAEIKVWNFLKGKNVLGQRFRAQHPLGFYLADFYCHSIKLIIEIDGEIHYDKIQKERDEERTRDLNNWKIDVIRFTNDLVFNEFEFVQQQIISAVQARLKLFPVETPRRRAAGNPIPSRTFLVSCSLTPPQSGQGMRSPEFNKIEVPFRGFRGYVNHARIIYNERMSPICLHF